MCHIHISATSECVPFVSVNSQSQCHLIAWSGEGNNHSIVPSTQPSNFPPIHSTRGQSIVILFVKYDTSRKSVNFITWTKLVPPHRTSVDYVPCKMYLWFLEASTYKSSSCWPGKRERNKFYSWTFCLFVRSFVLVEKPLTQGCQLSWLTRLSWQLLTHSILCSFSLGRTEH